MMHLAQEQLGWRNFLKPAWQDNVELRRDETSPSGRSEESTRATISQSGLIELVGQALRIGQDLRLSEGLSDLSFRSLGFLRHATNEPVTILHIIFYLHTLDDSRLPCDLLAPEDHHRVRRLKKEMRRLMNDLIQSETNRIRDGQVMESKELDMSRLILCAAEIMSGVGISARRDAEELLRSSFFERRFSKKASEVSRSLSFGSCKVKTSKSTIESKPIHPFSEYRKSVRPFELSTQGISDEEDLSWKIVVSFWSFLSFRGEGDNSDDLLELLNLVSHTLTKDAQLEKLRIDLSRSLGKRSNYRRLIESPNFQQLAENDRGLVQLSAYQADLAEERRSFIPSISKKSGSAAALALSVEELNHLIHSGDPRSKRCSAICDNLRLWLPQLTEERIAASKRFLNLSSRTHLYFSVKDQAKEQKRRTALSNLIFQEWFLLWSPQLLAETLLARPFRRSSNLDAAFSPCPSLNLRASALLSLQACADGQWSLCLKDVQTFLDLALAVPEAAEPFIHMAHVAGASAAAFLLHFDPEDHDVNLTATRIYRSMKERDKLSDSNPPHVSLLCHILGIALGRSEEVLDGASALSFAGDSSLPKWFSLMPKRLSVKIGGEEIEVECHDGLKTRRHESSILELRCELKSAKLSRLVEDENLEEVDSLVPELSSDLVALGRLDVRKMNLRLIKRQIACEVWLGRHKEAELMQQRCSTKFADDLELRYWSAFFARRAENYSLCLQICRAAWPAIRRLSKLPTRFVELYAEACELNIPSDPIKALDLYQLIIQRDSRNVAALYRAANLSLETKDQEWEAETLFQRVVDCVDNGKKQEGKSGSQLRKVFSPLSETGWALSKKSSTQLTIWSLLNLAELSLRRQQPSLAITRAEAALKRSHLCVDAKILKGWAQFQTREFHEALLTISQDLDCPDRDAFCRVNILAAALKERLGLLHVAQRHVQRTLESEADRFEALVQSSLLCAQADSSISPGSLRGAIPLSVSASQQAISDDEKAFTEAILSYETALVDGTTETTMASIRDCRLRIELESNRKSRLLFLGVERLELQLRFWEIAALFRYCSAEPRKDDLTMENAKMDNAKQINKADNAKADNAKADNAKIQLRIDESENEEIRLYACPFLIDNDGVEREQIFAFVDHLCSEFEFIHRGVEQVAVSLEKSAALCQVITQLPLLLIASDSTLLKKIVISAAFSRYLRRRPICQQNQKIKTHPEAAKPPPPCRYKKVRNRLSQENMQRPLAEVFDVPISISAEKALTRNDFAVGDVIGSGGFGTVYKGLMRKSGRKVAIKVAKFTLTSSMIRDIISEINSMARLSHPNLVELVGVCVEVRHLAIVTELCEGGNLHSKIRKDKFSLQPWQTKVRLAHQVASGVEYLHSQNPILIHRDIKSLNIVLDKCGNAKICDFGLSNFMEPNDTHVSMKKGAAGGSPRYMAPECYVTRGKISEKVDIWSLGCVLVEIFSGQLPFADCRDASQIMKRVLVDRLHPAIPENLPDEMKRMLKLVFSHEPKMRPSARALRELLEEELCIEI